MFNDAEHGDQKTEEFLGNYMAEVVEQTDPVSGSSGRVKVRVFPMMVGLEEAVLPWAVPAMPLFEGGSADAGAFVVPAIGSKVWVFFSCGDPRIPVYFAAALGMTDGPTTADPETKVWKTRTGHTFTVSDKAGEEKVDVTTSSGHKVTLDDNGNIVTILHKDGEKVVLTNDAVQLGKGALKKLVNEEFKSLFDSHTHGYVPSGSGTPSLTTVPSSSPTGTPPDVITPDMVTTDTKAS